MEKEKLRSIAWALVIISILGLPVWVYADKPSSNSNAEQPAQGTSNEKKPKVVYPGKTQLDFEGAQIEGELRNPGEFYFQHRPEEKFDSLIKRRKNFHKEMLRDVVLSK